MRGYFPLVPVSQISAPDSLSMTTLRRYACDRSLSDEQRGHGLAPFGAARPLRELDGLAD